MAYLFNFDNRFCHHRYLCNKDAEEEKIAKDRRIEEQQRIEEEYNVYKDEEEAFYDDDLIVPDKSHSFPVMSNSAYSDSLYAKNEKPISKEIEASQDSIIQTETDFYFVSFDGKELIEGKDVDNIIIPEGIERIKHGAFMNKKIKRIKFPKSLKYIESMAFANCSIEYLEVPATIDFF